MGPNDLRNRSACKNAFEQEGAEKVFCLCFLCFLLFNQNIASTPPIEKGP